MSHVLCHVSNTCLDHTVEETRLKSPSRQSDVNATSFCSAFIVISSPSAIKLKTEQKSALQKVLLAPPALPLRLDWQRAWNYLVFHSYSAPYNPLARLPRFHFNLWSVILQIFMCPPHLPRNAFEGLLIGFSWIDSMTPTCSLAVKCFPKQELQCGRGESFLFIFPKCIITVFHFECWRGRIKVS